MKGCDVAQDTGDTFPKCVLLINLIKCLFVDENLHILHQNFHYTCMII